MNASLDFPITPEAVTASWLSTVLDVTVQAVRVEAFGAGAGIIGQVTRLHLLADGGPTTLIAKFASPAEENRAVADAYDMYQREINFYQNIAPDISLRVPDCYFAAFDPQSSMFCLLLEDLGHLRIGDQVAGCTQADAEKIVRGIAHLHASTWRSRALVVSHNNPAQREGMKAGFNVGWPVVKAQFPDLIPEHLLERAAQMPDHVGSLLAQMCVDPICITHADVRLDNIFFDQDEIVLVDWQSVCTSAPEQDLAYFLTQSLGHELRGARDWVALYHQTLTELGVDYDLAQCRARYRVCALYLLCYAVIIAGTLDLGNERGRALGRTLFGNAMDALQEMDAFALLEG